ncbi:hypothetical protein SH1V18_18550 [Vallitalea longa]|uniref:Knr4/Smi1-like domain-containing protein n=1 Tax=Vallitalea longa TaxID=2936439 RepID=A0A9W5YB49_9FIRM|nr:SMI1/KNR4 family protein [Vallitalea longa]GKX29375.1 hypothetical protein SH1V18_18550 [Vallitalea longa]
MKFDRYEKQYLQSYITILDSCYIDNIQETLLTTTNKDIMDKKKVTLKMLISKFDNNSDMQSEVLNFEKRYNVTLPKQYKEFLHKYNGGFTPKTKFKVGKISSNIRNFYGIGNVKVNLETLGLNEWIDKGILPIACDSFGNYIVIGLKSYNEGKIYFWNHEEGTKVDYIIDDLFGFVDLCKSEKISDASKRTIKEREDALIAKGRGSIITDDLREMWQKEIDKYGNMNQEEVIMD